MIIFGKSVTLRKKIRLACVECSGASSRYGKGANPMNRSKKEMVPVVDSYFEFYLEDIAVGAYCVDNVFVPVIRESDMLTAGTIFMVNKNSVQVAFPSEIICAVSSNGTISRGTRTWFIYECEYYSRSNKTLLKQKFAVIKDS